MVVDLAESRKKIDEIDKEIIRLFEERMEVANDVAIYKRSTGKKVYDPVRESEKIATLRSMASNTFNETAVEDLFRQIMSISRKYQYQKLGPTVNHIPFRQVEKLDVDENTRVVYFGEKGAFTEQAMIEYFGKNINAFHKTTFKEVMETVANGDALFGVLPIENTSTGSISDIYDLMVDYDITIVAEHIIKVNQSLLGLPGAKIEDLKTIYSHPQGLMQCANFLSEHPQIEGVEFESTAAAAKKVSEEKDVTQGAIASVRAAEEFGLEVLQETINQHSQNFTRFIVISNQKIYLQNANKISLSFEIKHEAGSLYNMLANFYYNDLNLTKIESRPMHKGNWEYRFFVDIEGNLEDSGVGNAMATIEEYANNLKIMGNFADKPQE
ncbi:MAG: prephenate dehydratase [Lachnospiraceae bacterium]|nr:prephenate dehydratase [Lachnospiraceae bacterium]